MAASVPSSPILNLSPGLNPATLEARNASPQGHSFDIRSLGGERGWSSRIDMDKNTFFKNGILDYFNTQVIRLIIRF